MEDEREISEAVSYIRDLFREDAGGHDAAHSLRVYRNAVQIAKTVPGCDLHVVSLAALLHDADDHKLFSTKNNENARRFLEGQGEDAQTEEKICRVIGEVSFSRNRGRKPSTPEGMIVQDADRLDALGAVGIARTFAYGGMHGRPMDSSIGHFHEKLLLLKDGMNTEKAREMAIARHRFLEAFLAEYSLETGEDTQRRDIKEDE